jgi:hypothetical protein
MNRNNPRYPKGTFTPFTINFVHAHNPNIITWWSASLPGFGHIAQCKILTGILLVSWEFSTNIYSHLNEAMIYTFSGQFNLAKDVLNLRIFLLYFPVYLFTIWDSRKNALEINQLNILSDRNEEYISTTLTYSNFELNYLARRNPLMAAIWSVFCPGLGHIYINRIIMGFTGLFSFVTTVYFSKILLVIPSLIVGNFDAAIYIIDKEWFLFFPSLYAFFIYDSYINAIEYNKLFKQEKRHYFKQEYAFTKNDFDELWKQI